MQDVLCSFWISRSKVKVTRHFLSDMFTNIRVHFTYERKTIYAYNPHVHVGGMIYMAYPCKGGKQTFYLILWLWGIIVIVPALLDVIQVLFMYTGVSAAARRFGDRQKAGKENEEKEQKAREKQKQQRDDLAAKHLSRGRKKVENTVDNRYFKQFLIF